MSAAETFDHGRASQLFASSERSVRWRWFWLTLLAMCVPMLVPYLANLWKFEHYQYFPFAFLAAGYFLYTRWDRVFRGPRGWVGWTMIATGLLGLVVAVAFPSAWFGGFSFVILALAFMHSASGEEDRDLLVSAMPLLMLLQIPLRLDRSLIIRLQKATTELSSVVLDIFAVPHAVAGNVIQLAKRELFVAEACSGIQSVFTLAFLACVLVAWNRRRLWLTPAYLLIAVLLAIAGNVFRVSTIAMASAWWGLDLSGGWQHELIGYIALALAGLLLLSFDQLVVTLLHPTSGTGGETSRNPVIWVWNFIVAGWRDTGDETAYGYRPEADASDVREPKESWLDRLVAGRLPMARPIGFAMLGLAGLVTVAAATQATRVEIGRDWDALISSELLVEPTPALLEGQYGFLTVEGHQAVRDGTEPRLGQNADLWDFRAGDYAGQLVLSQTYAGWHELTVCYEILEWHLVDREVCLLAADEMQRDESGSFITARFKGPDGQYGYLLFTGVNADGTIPEAPSSLGAMGTVWLDRLERHGVIRQQNLAMLQMWLVTPQKMTPRMLKEIQQDFVAIRGRVAEAIMAGSDPPVDAQ